MAYSKSKRAIYRVEEYLKQIIDSKDTVIRFTTPEPSKFAYLIRQALHSASYNDVPPYNHLPVKVIETPDGVEIVKLNWNFAIPEKASYNEVKNFSQLMLTVAANPKVKEFEFPNANLNELESELFIIWKDANNLIGDSTHLERKLDNALSEAGKVSKS